MMFRGGARLEWSEMQRENAREGGVSKERSKQQGLCFRDQRGWCLGLRFIRRCYGRLFRRSEAANAESEATTRHFKVYGAVPGSGYGEATPDGRLHFRKETNDNYIEQKRKPTYWKTNPPICNIRKRQKMLTTEHPRPVIFRGLNYIEQKRKPTYWKTNPPICNIRKRQKMLTTEHPRPVIRGLNYIEQKRKPTC
ncbi:uncharacterized protein [Periplaneta americana]|uniref:uncharacterized protein isoform X2 n=1 Tax=Periplaneta americana TaxID=6978 RepID=UPI0037E8FA59